MQVTSPLHVLHCAILTEKSTKPHDELMTTIFPATPSHYTPAVIDDVSLLTVLCYSELCSTPFAMPVGGAL